MSDWKEFGGRIGTTHIARRRGVWCMRTVGNWFKIEKMMLMENRNDLELCRDDNANCLPHIIDTPEPKLEETNEPMKTAQRCKLEGDLLIFTLENGLNCYEDIGDLYEGTKAMLLTMLKDARLFPKVTEGGLNAAYWIEKIERRKALREPEES